MTSQTTLYKIDYNFRKNSLLRIVVEEYAQAAMAKGEGAFFRGSNITANTSQTHVWRDGAINPLAADWAFVLVFGVEKLKRCLHELFVASNPDLDDQQAKQYVDDVIDELYCSRTLNRLFLN